MPKVLRGAKLCQILQDMGLARGGMSVEAIPVVEIEAYGRAIGGLSQGERLALYGMSRAYCAGLKLTNPLAKPD